MTPVNSAIADRPSSTLPEIPPPPAAPSKGVSSAVWMRVATSLALLVGYFYFRESLVEWLRRTLLEQASVDLKATSIGVWLVALLIVSLVYLWRKTLAKDKRFHAPLLITSILLVGDAAFGILLNHYSPVLGTLTGGLMSKYSPTFVAILTTVVAEMLIGRFFYGKWPHLASAYVSGISAGILVKSNGLWPFVMCGLISITSKYVLRIGDRHIWNPTNFGMTVMLFMATNHMASLSVEAGNAVWSVLVIWILGAMILYQLGRLHQPIVFVLAFIPLSYLRSWWTGDEFLTELAPITSPMFQLYIFFMITDPKTTVKSKKWQTIVVLLVAIMETFLRLAFRDKYSLYHALFIVGPIANVVEIAYLYYFAKSPQATARVSPELSGWGPVKPVS
jgi:hypothetical protein